MDIQPSSSIAGLTPIGLALNEQGEQVGVVYRDKQPSTSQANLGSIRTRAHVFEVTRGSRSNLSSRGEKQQTSALGS